MTHPRKLLLLWVILIPILVATMGEVAFAPTSPGVAAGMTG
jgi:hypothetical protein